jgi:hypothetical protein
VYIILDTLELQIEKQVMEFGPAVNQMRRKIRVVLRVLTNLLIILTRKLKSISLIEHLGILLIIGKEILMEVKQTLNYMADIVGSSEMLSLISQRILASLKLH